MTRIVTKTEEEFWKKLKDFTAPHSVFDAQGEDHGDIDLRLVEKIDGYLVPKIGQWEQSDRWFHNIDFYGDGIRSLELCAQSFSPPYLQDFQGMLIGEHSDFTILCKILTDFSDASSRIGSIAVRGDQILVSYPLVAHFNGEV